MSGLDLSIVIISWNARQYLLDCLASIRDTAAGIAHEVIVVDNASHDGSPEAVRAQFPDVRLIETGANLGFARGNNVGVRQARGRHVALINSDVIVLPGCLQALVAFMDAHPRVGLAGPRVLNADRTLQPSCRDVPTLWTYLGTALGLGPLLERAPAEGAAGAPPRPVGILSGCFWIARAESLKTVGLLDEDFFMYGEDLDWCIRFQRAGWQRMYVPAAEAIHFGGASSSNRPVHFYLEMKKSGYFLWKKYHGAGSTLLYTLISIGYHGSRLCSCGLLYLLLAKKRLALGDRVRMHAGFLRWLLLEGRTLSQKGSRP